MILLDFNIVGKIVLLLFSLKYFVNGQVPSSRRHVRFVSDDFDGRESNHISRPMVKLKRSPSPDDSKVVLVDSRYFEVYTVPSENNNVIIRIRSHPDCTDAVPPHGYPTPAQYDPTPKDDGSSSFWTDASQRKTKLWKRKLGALIIECILPKLADAEPSEHCRCLNDICYNVN